MPRTGASPSASSPGHAAKPVPTVKVVVTGDAAVGKTSMLHSYTSDTFPQAHVPTVFDNYSARCWVNGEPLELSLWDTAGQADYDPLRPLSYPGTHCFIVVCSVDSDASVRAMMSKWLVELKHHNPDAPFILCCNKVDLLDAEKAAGAPGAADLDLDAGRKVIRMAQQHSQTEPGCAAFLPARSHSRTTQGPFRHGHRA
ncbi:hypothetical protein FNF28_03280 [Cafeteria roenbergensis]|uniref:Uncharacterized protein n=1 Tax=Cafeteria roenbergensis TaxID=33653 RepID=A0A5A8DL70_CAFRO|nr:hypothetical protein FNF28_03280 [Cafeteria roenbergensis]